MFVEVEESPLSNPPLPKPPGPWALENPGVIVIMSAPKVPNLDSSCCWAPSLIDIIETTAAIPIIIPSIVNQLLVCYEEVYLRTA